MEVAMTDEVSVEMAIPLDSDGFVRRACPTCEREFKWLHTESAEEDQGEAASIAPGGYFCPYCGIQADTDQWLTDAQVEYAQNLIATRVVGPMMKNFSNEMNRVGRRSSGFLRTEMKYDGPQEFDPLTEMDDMTRVDFDCHPTEPVKVVDGWTKAVHCLICGSPKR
jgi:hypothetical protein